MKKQNSHCHRFSMNSYYFWYDYRMGNIKRELTIEEMKEVSASDFAMNLLLPKKSFKAMCDICGGMENVFESNELMKIFSDYFGVNISLVKVRLKVLIDEEKERLYVSSDIVGKRILDLIDFIKKSEIINKDNSLNMLLNIYNQYKSDLISCQSSEVNKSGDRIKLLLPSDIKIDDEKIVKANYLLKLDNFEELFNNELNKEKLSKEYDDIYKVLKRIK